MRCREQVRPWKEVTTVGPRPLSWPKNILWLLEVDGIVRVSLMMKAAHSASAVPLCGSYESYFLLSLEGGSQAEAALAPYCTPPDTSGG